MGLTCRPSCLSSLGFGPENNMQPMKIKNNNVNAELIKFA
jgi:hypothetical protein